MERALEAQRQMVDAAMVEAFVEAALWALSQEAAGKKLSTTKKRQG